MIAPSWSMFFALLLSMQSTLQVEVDLVNVSATVHDAEGRYLDGLAAEDFRLYEDDIEQRIQIFERSEDLPSSLGLLIDNSGSSADILASIKNGVVAFADRLHPDDEMFVMSFGIAAEVVHGFADNRSHLRAALDRLRSWGTSVFFDAIYSGIGEAVLGQHDRKALIVLSDGNDNRSRASYLEVVQAAQSSSVMLYFIGMGPRILVDSHTLEGLASMTGGRVVLLAAERSPEEALEEIRRELSHQYYLGYHASGETGYHTIRVEVPGRNVTVRARDGYRVSR